MAFSAPIDRPPVLVVEDEPVLRGEVIDMVRGAGFEPVEATNAKDAILILEMRSDIRIVYMDLDMPRGIRGIEIAAAIRDRWPPIEMILTAAFFDKADLKLPERAEFYPKPIHHRQIVSAMHRMSTAS